MDESVPKNAGPLWLSRDCKAAGKAFDNLKREDEKASYDTLGGRQLAAWMNCSPVWNNGDIDTKKCNESRENLAKLDEKWCEALSKYDGTSLTSAAKTVKPITSAPIINNTSPQDIKELQSAICSIVKKIGKENIKDGKCADKVNEWISKNEDSPLANIYNNYKNSISLKRNSKNLFP